MTFVEVTREAIPPDMLTDISDKSAIIAATTGNFKARVSCMIQSNPQMSVLTLGDTVYTDVKLSSRVLNIAVGGDFSLADSEARARKIRDHYRSETLQFSLWLGPLSNAILQSTDEHLKAAGYDKSDEVLVGMVALLSNATSTTSRFPPPKNLRIFHATTPEQLHDFGEVINSVFPPPPYEGYLDFAEFNADLSKRIDFSSLRYRMFIGYVDGEPIATSGVMLDSGVAGIYDIATKPAHRRQGYAALMMQALLNEARTEGYVVTTLLASKDGKGVYEQLGYKEFGEWHIWNDA